MSSASLLMRPLSPPPTLLLRGPHGRVGPGGGHRLPIVSLLGGAAAAYEEPFGCAGIFAIHSTEAVAGGVRPQLSPNLLGPRRATREGPVRRPSCHCFHSGRHSSRGPIGPGNQAAPKQEWADRPSNARRQAPIPYRVALPGMAFSFRTLPRHRRG